MSHYEIYLDQCSLFWNNTEIWLYKKKDLCSSSVHCRWGEERNSLTFARNCIFLNCWWYCRWKFCKLYSLLLSSFNSKQDQISTLLLSLLESSGNTGEGIFYVVDSELSCWGIPWSNYTCFPSDNVYTMLCKNVRYVAIFVKGLILFVSSCTHFCWKCSFPTASKCREHFGSAPLLLRKVLKDEML